eukprot:m.37680 g.37680  ORF g.37680 m.37680 type:complete len:131 (-) comp14585_c1_seq4:2300-2692(-)
MATWTQHVQALVSTGNVKQCSIHGVDGNLWASTEGFSPSVEEAAAINKYLSDDFAAQLLPAAGVVANGTKYMYVRHQPDRNVYAKRGAGGICVGKSGRALVFATYESPMSFQNCIYEVEKLVDFLISMQY